MNQSTNHNTTEQFAAFIATDWADQTHAYSLKAAGDNQKETGTLEQKPEVSAVLSRCEVLRLGKRRTLMRSASRFPQPFDAANQFSQVCRRAELVAKSPRAYQIPKRQVRLLLRLSFSGMLHSMPD